MTQNENKNNTKTIIGKVDKIVFRDIKTGRSILSVIKDDGKSCRVLGNIEDVEKDITLRATGVWRNDDKYGWQFFAESIQKVSGTDNEQKSIDDGLIHALDFSNLLNKTLKEFRHTDGINDYTEEEKLYTEIENNGINSNNKNSDKDGISNNDKLDIIDGATYCNGQTVLVRVPVDVTTFKIPDTVISIGNSAFKNCASLTDVIMGDSVVSIGDYAFLDCSNLKSITLSQRLERIGQSVFAGCNDLENLIIPSSVKYIGEGTLDYISNFKIERIFEVYWKDVTFSNNYISVIAKLGNYSPRLRIDYQGVSEKMNKGKHILEDILPTLKVKMLSKGKGVIVDSTSLQKLLFTNVTMDLKWEEVDFLDKYIRIKTPWGKSIDVYDKKINHYMNDIRDYLTRHIPSLHVHFSSIVNAEIQNIEEVHNIAIVLEMKNNISFSLSKSLTKLDGIKRSHNRLFLPRHMSPYVSFLFQNHDINTYPIVPIEEGEGGSKEKGALFTVMINDIPHIVWENFNDARATYVFKCIEDNYMQKRQIIFDYVMSNNYNKRRFIHTKECESILGEKPRIIVHNNFTSWAQKLMCDNDLVLKDESNLIEEDNI